MKRVLVLLSLLVLAALPTEALAWTHGSNASPLAPYTGQIVSRTIFPDDVNTTNKQLRARRIVVTKDAISGTIQLVFPNVYVDGFGAGATYQELGPGGASTLTFALEYPLGTNGVAGTCPNGGVIPNASTITCTWTGSIPANSVVGVRTFLTNPAGVVFSLGISGYPAPAANVPGTFQFGDVLDAAPSGLTDNTTNGGAYTGTSGSSSYGPILVAGQTTLPSILAIGDSIEYGENDAGDGSGDVGAVARWTNPLFATATWGTRGQDAGQFVANCVIRCSFSSFFTHLVNEDGVNGFIHGQSAATVATNTTALGNKFPTLTKYITTILPSATSTDNYATLANQTLPSYSAGVATENARRRAVPTPFVGVFDSAAALESALGSGLVAVQAGGTGTLLYYVQAASSVHPVWDGYHQIAQANLATAASVINRNGTPLAFSPRLFTYEQDHVEDATGRSTYTFTGTRPNGVLVGLPNPNRLVVANCIARFGTTGATTVSMTIGGVAASKVAFGGVTAEQTNVNGGAESLHTLWYANVPNGNTATISAVYSTTMLRAGCDIWTVVGLNGVPIVSGATNSGAAGTTVTNVMTVPTGGSVIVGTSTGNGTAPTLAVSPTGYVSGILTTATLVGGTTYYGSGSVTQPGTYTLQSAWSAGVSTTSVAGAFSPTSTYQTPGPSAALFNAPYYSCTRNFYVNASTGSDSNTATQAQNSGTPWLTIAKYDAGTGFTPTAGDCINAANGTYTAGNNNLVHGGSTASATGYITYRCQTLNGCTITATGAPGGVFSGGTASSGSFPDYLIFDGFVLNSAQGHTAANATAFNCINGDVTPTPSNQCHHWWIINNDISWYGQSGIQLNDSEYNYAFHNRITNTSQDCQAAQGSGISFATWAQISGGYSPTADDSSNPTMGIYTSGIHGMASFNVVSNAFIGCTTPGGNSDGNGIIFDQNGNAAGVYSPVVLISFNVVYNNGGNGIRLFAANSENVVVANNSCFNTNLDLFNSGTARYCFGDNASKGNNTFVNNIGNAIPGASGVTHSNAAICLCGSSGAVADTALNNITLCNTTPAGGCEQTFNGNSYSGVNNKTATNPLWVNVGNTSAGTESTQPVGVNFALQGSSPAVGYLSATAAAYLPPATRDAGACDRSLASCP